MEKILVVDDTPEAVWPLVQELESDYAVFTASDGRRALTIAAEEMPELILLDIIMPEMDGYEVLERLRANSRTRDIPVVFLTSKVTEEDEIKGFECGAQGYMTKPVRLAVAKARIRSLIDIYKGIEQRLFLMREKYAELNSLLEEELNQKIREVDRLQRVLSSSESKYDRLLNPPKATGEGRQSLLVVDDNVENIHLLMENLEDDYDVLFATSGFRALEIVFSEDRPDLILLDIMMPGMDGYEVCSRLKADSRSCDIPVIFLTAMSQEEDETKGLDLGAVDFILKPFSMPIVRARVDVALKLKREMDQRLELSAKLHELNQDLEQRVAEKTEHLRQAHDQLKESEKKYRDIFENAMEGIFQSNSKGKPLRVSPSLTRILGYDSPEELLSAISDIATQLCVRPEDYAAFHRAMEEKGEVRGMEMQLRKKDGDLIWAAVSGWPIACEEQDTTRCIQGFVVDTTELKQMRELMVQNEKIMSLGGMTGGMAHEINNSLTAVLGNAQNVLIRLDPEKEHNRTLADSLGLEFDRMLDYVRERKIDYMLQVLHEQGKRAAETVYRMLEYTRKTDAPASGHDINEIVQKALDLAAKDYDINTRFSYWSVEVTRELTDGLPLVNCAPNELEQVLFNLIKNASHAMAERAKQQSSLQLRLILRTRLENQQIVVEVQDNGIGMDDKTIKRAFEPFFTTKPVGVGTGLGLSVASFIIKEKYRGELEVVSSRGKGALFTIRLPAGNVEHKDAV